MPERKRNVHNISIYMMYCSPFSGIEPSCTFRPASLNSITKAWQRNFTQFSAKKKDTP